MTRYFSVDEEIFINQFVQHIHSIEIMEDWFNEKDCIDKRDVILNVLLMVIQAHPTYDEIQVAVTQLCLTTSPSAVKLLNVKKPYSKYGYELASLPERELVNAFKLLLQVLSIADNRRRNIECVHGCRHWWHQDLSDESVILSLKQLQKRRDR